MRAFITIIVLALVAIAKSQKHDAPASRKRALRKEAASASTTAPKRQLAEEQLLGGFRAHGDALHATHGLLTQVANTITATGHDLVDTAVRGNRLLRADAKLTIGNAVEPIYTNLQGEARSLADSTRGLADSLGLDTFKSDAKKVIVAAADVVKQGEQNLASAILELASSINV